MNDAHVVRDANRATVEKLFEAGAQESRSELFGPDAKKVLPFGGRVLARDVWLGTGELEEEASSSKAMLTGSRAYHDQVIFDCVDPTQFWVFNRFGPDTQLYGTPYPQRFAHHLTVEDGKVTRWDEYFDSHVLARTLFGEQAPEEFPEVTDLRREPREHADPDAVRAENEAALRAFLDGDPYSPRARETLWADDAVKELAWIPPGFRWRRWSGIDALKEETREGRDHFVYTIHSDLHVYPTLDPEVFWATSVMDPRSRFDGKSYPQRFILGFRVEDGKIAVFQEFFDTALAGSM